MKTQYLCLPLLKCSPGGAAAAAAGAPPPPSLFDRFRVAVFRLIMLSTISKAGGGGSEGVAATPSHHRGNGWSSPASASARSYYKPPYDDPHQSEAVADCIEFLRKSSVMTTPSHGASETGAGEGVKPVPVV